MALNNSGPISFGGATAGQSINLELGVSATALASINSAAFRGLAGVASGQISVSNFYGKSNAPTVIGQAFGGGYYAGQIGVSSTATHYLIVGPRSSAQSTNKQYKNADTAVSGADSAINGPQNTADMVASGNATVYPAAHFCNDLVTGGFSDWYMPAKNELEVCYYNLKPTTASNDTSSGINPNAVPARASNYSSGTPSRTSASDYIFGGSQSFTADAYWSSTENTAGSAWYQRFNNGYQAGIYNKTNYLIVRAVRRVAV